MSAFLTNLLANIIRPIIRDELQDLKKWAFFQSQRFEDFKEIDKETGELIDAAEQASTPEEAKAHLRRLKETRARLNS